METGIRVEYTRDIAGHDGNPARFKGETYVVADEDAARKYHPFAEIVEREDGQPVALARSGEAIEHPRVWYRKRLERAAAEGVEIPELLEGETEKEYDARVAAEVEQEAAAREAGENATPTGEGTETGGETS